MTTLEPVRPLAGRRRYTRKQRRLMLIGAAGAVLFLAAGLVLFALRDTIEFALKPRVAWAARAKAVLGLARTLRVSGLVHVYVEPEARGAAGGAALMRGAMRPLRRLGITHALTLADDAGSGKLREWYEALGIVDASNFMETAMVART